MNLGRFSEHKKAIEEEKKALQKIASSVVGALKRAQVEVTEKLLLKFPVEATLLNLKAGDVIMVDKSKIDISRIEVGLSHEDNKGIVHPISFNKDGNDKTYKYF